MKLCNYVITIFYFVIGTITYVKKHNGKQLAILNGYTFRLQKKHKNTLHWQCTTGKCKAKFVISDSGELKMANTEHVHPPPKYITVNGIYVNI